MKTFSDLLAISKLLYLWSYLMQLSLPKHEGLALFYPEQSLFKGIKFSCGVIFNFGLEPRCRRYLQCFVVLLENYSKENIINIQIWRDSCLKSRIYIYKTIQMKSEGRGLIFFLKMTGFGYGNVPEYCRNFKMHQRLYDSLQKTCMVWEFLVETAFRCWLKNSYPNYQILLSSINFS